MYNIAKAGFLDGTENWEGNTYKITLVSNNYTANPDHSAASQFSGAEISGSNHTSGFSGTIRKTLTGTSVVQNDTDDQAELDAADITWSAISAGTAHAAIILRESGSDALSPLIAFIDTGGLALAA